MNREGQPMVMRSALLWMQVCVPKDWTKDQVENWANIDSPSGTSGGWECLGAKHAEEHGYEEYAQCEEHGSHHHILLGC